MDKILLALMCGVMVFYWLTESSDWVLPVGLGVATLTMSGWVILSFGLMLGGLEMYLAATRFENKRDRQEQEAEVFLQRLAQLLQTHGTLSLALQDLGYRDHATGREPNPEHILSGLFHRWNVAVVGMVASASLAVAKHGGGLGPVVEQAAKKISRDRERRFQRQLDEAAKRTTMVVLALAPYGVMGALREMVPSMYAVLTTRIIGEVAVLLVGLVSGGVLAILALYVRKDGVSR